MRAAKIAARMMRNSRPPCARRQRCNVATHAANVRPVVATGRTSWLWTVTPRSLRRCHWSQCVAPSCVASACGAEAELDHLLAQDGASVAARAAEEDHVNA